MVFLLWYVMEEWTWQSVITQSGSDVVVVEVGVVVVVVGVESHI